MRPFTPNPYGNYYERKAYREQRAPQIAAAKAAKAALAKTCQICARPIFAETGTIAHHGYQRPGHGWQTASCFGAKRLPFEVSRDALGEYIGLLRDQLVRMKANRKEVLAETRPVFISYSQQVETGEISRYGRKVTESREVHLQVTRANFNALVAEHPDCKAFTIFDRVKYARVPTIFDALLNADLIERAGKIKEHRAYIVSQQSRFDGWKPAVVVEGGAV